MNTPPARGRSRAARLARGLAAAALIALCAGASGRDLVLLQPLGVDVDAQDAARDYVAGAQVYVDAVNERGGVRGQRLVLRSEAVGDPAAFAALMQRATTDPQVVALFGPVGQPLIDQLAASPAVRQRQVAVFAPLSGGEAGAAGMTYVRASYRAEAARLTEWFGANRVGTLAMVRDAGTGEIAQAVRNSAQRASVKVVGDVAASGDAGAVATAVAATHAQVVLLVTDTLRAGQIVKALRPRAPGTYIVSLSNIAQQTLLELAGPAAVGTVLTQVVPGPRSLQVAVVQEHLRAMKRFRDEPPSYLTIEGYIAAKALVAVMSGMTAPIERGALVQALAVPRELDVGGFPLQLGGRGRASSYVDLTMLRRDGSLLQ
ncbi:MAG: ABC transporter substrate-binding protein [Proteobacteria bacterium]|nr:ABC transporter substrate-binding protein [Pseudomonadota bacterium]